MNPTSVPHVAMVHDRILCDTPSMMHQVQQLFARALLKVFAHELIPRPQAAPLHPLEHMQKNWPASQLQRQVRAHSIFLGILGGLITHTSSGGHDEVQRRRWCSPEPEVRARGTRARLRGRGCLAHS